MERPIGLMLTLLFVPAQCFGKDLHGQLTGMLSSHVRDGWVDYRSLRSDGRLRDYCSWLAAADPKSFGSEKDRLAFWINAYNAYTLKVIVDNYPVKSINDLHGGGLLLGTVFKTTVWDKKLVTINGEKTTLNWIEHKVIRPQFKDPRAHFALVCASRSCPPLRSEAYEGHKLDQQLDDQARKFLLDPARNSLDPETKTANLSKIFDWYSKDFGRNNQDALRYIARFLPPGLQQSILANASAWKIRYRDYDWALNEAPAR